MAGGLSLYLNVARIDAHTWLPLRVPFEMSSGATAVGQFTAELDEIYEIELDFEYTIPDRELFDLVGSLEFDSPLDLSWSVSHNDSVVARGDAREFLYYTYGSLSTLGKLRRWTFADPFHRSERGSVARGIGRLRAEAGETYELRIEVGQPVERLVTTQPELQVRLNRVFYQRYIASGANLAYIGLGLLGLSFAGFGLWGLGRIRRKLRASVRNS